MKHQYLILWSDLDYTHWRHYTQVINQRFGNAAFDDAMVAMCGGGQI